MNVFKKIVFGFGCLLWRSVTILVSFPIAIWYFFKRIGGCILSTRSGNGWKCIKTIPGWLCENWKELPFFKKLIWRFTIYGTAGLIAIFSNPFGWNDMTEKKSQEVISKVVSHWYPFKAENHNEKVVVVLVNGKSLDLISDLPEPERITFSNEWPILYKDHANILKTIAAYSKPKQIFIDIEFHKIRNTDSSFDQLINTLGKLKNKKGISISHAIGSVDESIPEEINAKLSEVSTPVFNGWQSDAMPLFKVNNKNQKILSPALQMYSNYKKQSLNYDEFTDEMFVFWDGNFDSKKYNQSISGCTAEESLSAKFRAAGRSFLSSFASFDDEQPTCYSQRVVYLDELQRLLSQGKPGKEKIKEIFDDSHVLYGTSYIALGDKVFSPVHGNIPGVFYHAMAFENLIEFESGYYKSLGKNLEVIFWLVLAALLAIAMADKKTKPMVGNQRCSFGASDSKLIVKFIEDIAKHRALIVVLIVIGYLTIVTGITWFGDLAPANILGMLSFVTLIYFLFKTERGCSHPDECDKETDSKSI